MHIEESNSKRIARNTLLLYFRMIIIMLVQLFTVRIILSTLGEVDYGIYNVVGGVVSMFAFLSATMTTASQRYFAYEIGTGNQTKLKQTFSTTLLIYCILALIILLLAETVGLWFLNHRLTIPVNRLVAANWVYQFSILTFMLTMFQVPYDAIVIAREKMNVFAYVSILEVILKLVIVYVLYIIQYDKLISYSVLVFMVTFIITTIYKIYCLRNFKESHFQWFWDKRLFKELLSYSGWNLFGASAGMMNNQGINIVLNLFFGPAVNAARAVAYQINSAINSFVHNFMTATRPQITKYYAQGEINKMIGLVFQSSKFSFFLLYLVSLPILVEMPYILKLWLKEVPDYTILFARIIIVTALVDSLSLSLMTAVQATGKIKFYQMIVGSIILLNVPLAYFSLKMGAQPQMVLYIVLITSVVCLWLRLYILRTIIGELSIKQFFATVFFPVVVIATLSFALLVVETKYIDASFFRLCITSILSFLIILVSVYYIGFSKEYRGQIVNMILKKIRK